MKTTKHVLAICIGMMMISFANAQNWQTNGNTISGSEWFGATSSSTIELDIEHQAEDLPIRFFTSPGGGMLQRMLIMHDNTDPRIGIGPHPLSTGTNIWPATCSA